MSRERYDISDLGRLVGQELGVSDWLTVDTPGQGTPVTQNPKHG